MRFRDAHCARLPVDHFLPADIHMNAFRTLTTVSLQISRLLAKFYKMPDTEPPGSVNGTSTTMKVKCGKHAILTTGYKHSSLDGSNEPATHSPSLHSNHSGVNLKFCITM